MPFVLGHSMEQPSTTGDKYTPPILIKEKGIESISIVLSPYLYLISGNKANH